MKDDTMPWPAIAFRQVERLKEVKKYAGAGIPCLVVVDRDGKVSDIKALTNHGYEMEQEAIRVLNKSDKWIPANQNGRTVKAYRIQPITFAVTEG